MILNEVATILPNPPPPRLKTRRAVALKSGFAAVAAAASYLFTLEVLNSAGSALKPEVTAEYASIACGDGWD